MEQIPAIIRRFREGHAKEVDRQIISTYFPLPMKKAFLKGIGDIGKIRPNDYILGPLYKGGDLQIGVTGGRGVQELAWKATARELGEEVGLVPRSKRDLWKLCKGNYGTRRGNKEMQVFDLYIRHTYPVLDHQHGVTIPHGRDDPRLKVGCFIYGTRDDIFQFLDEDIYVYESPDDIAGVGAFKASDILKWIESS